SPRHGQHSAKDTAAGLQRLFDLLQVVGQDRRLDAAGLDVNHHLLDQRQHRSDGVIDIVRNPTGQIGDSVFLFGLKHLGLEDLSPLRILYRDGGQWHEPLKELRFVATEGTWMARRYLEYPKDAVPSAKRRTQERGFPRDGVRTIRGPVV